MHSEGEGTKVKTTYDTRKHDKIPCKNSALQSTVAVVKIEHSCKTLHPHINGTFIFAIAFGEQLIETYCDHRLLAGA
mgnify:CR=1 FL=1